MSAFTECSICLSPPTSACLTKCNHTFCQSCFTQAMKFRAPWYSGTCPICRSSVSLYNTANPETGQFLASPPVRNLWGQVYLQGGLPGVASYHFDSPISCYISYEHAPDNWRLKDDSKPPSKKHFTNPHYDEKTRTFRGVINWGDNTFFGDSTWTYEMIFSETFAIIEGGGMVSDSGETDDFPEGLVYWRQQDLSTLGNMYCQGRDAIGVASYHFTEGVANAWISYENAPETWVLDNGQRPPGKKEFENATYDDTARIFRGEIVWKEGFRGDFKWEFEMVFSEDFMSIESGRNKKYDKDGCHTGGHRFGPRGALKYYVFDESKAAMEELYALRLT